MAFHNIQFPANISFGATGGPERRVEIVERADGHEERNLLWQRSRRRFNAASGIKSLDELAEIIAFYEARSGMAHGFRWKDWSDYKSCQPSLAISSNDQILGQGDGNETRFQLIKSYLSGDHFAIRNITKPIKEATLFALDGTTQKADDFELDDMTGVVAFHRPPAKGAMISAGFEFDVPVRFDVEHLIVNTTLSNAGEISNIPIVEIFE